MRIICILVPSFIYAYAYYDINTYFHVASPQLPLCLRRFPAPAENSPLPGPLHFHAGTFRS